MKTSFNGFLPLSANLFSENTAKEKTPMFVQKLNIGVISLLGGFGELHRPYFINLIIPYFRPILKVSLDYIQLFLMNAIHFLYSRFTQLEYS